MNGKSDRPFAEMLGRHLRPLLVVAMVFAWFSAIACGPNFPNWLLDGGDFQILSAPLASFAGEIRRVGLPDPGCLAQPSESGRQGSDSRDAELADLKLALTQSGLGSERVNAVVEAHAAQRAILLDYVAARQSWETSYAWIYNNVVPPPPFPQINIVDGLPLEFVAYFRGAIAWHAGDTNGARAAWTELLELPVSQRHYKSIWAAYMLGRSWEDDRPGRAAKYYQQVRRLAEDGSGDSAGLAAASLGREALTHFRAGDCKAAIGLYLQQAAAGDPTALVSLRLTAARAIWDHPHELKSLARDPLSRRVITAYLISSVMTFASPVHLDGVIRERAIETLAKIKYFRNSAPNWHRYEKATTLWLKAVESADITEAEEAEVLALAAYQAGEFEVASHWLKKSSNNTLALWLRAKLLLRDGDVDKAAALLAMIVCRTREENASGEDSQRTALSDGLEFPLQSSWNPARTPGKEALGEMGALLLVQGEYREALDALLRSGFWLDAAYVAERVLTAEELKSYVQLNWNASESNDLQSEGNLGRNLWQPMSDQTQAIQIRYLLARRLIRLGQIAEARPFLPASLHPQLDALDAALAQGRNDAASKDDRAAALWSAALIIKTNGLELIGTEVEPDWAVYGGNFSDEEIADSRTNSLALPPTGDELTRAEQHHVSPEHRFHYRYLAADLAWEAAELMPDNTDETADVLYTAGCWLKYLNPKAADLFYKALVNRCRKTALGQAADKKRWFPGPDEVENLSN